MHVQIAIVLILVITMVSSFFYGSTIDKERYWPAWWILLGFAAAAYSYLVNLLLRDEGLLQWTLGILVSIAGIGVIMALSYKSGVLRHNINALKTALEKTPLSPEDQELFDKAQKLAKELIEAVERTGAVFMHSRIFRNRVYIHNGDDNDFIVIGEGIIGYAFSITYPTSELFIRVDVEHAIRVMEQLLKELEQK